MAVQINHDMIMKALDYCYDKALNGLPGMQTAQQLASDYLKADGESLIHSAKKLVRWQIAKASTSGFLTGIGGLMTLPIAIPANITSVIYIQLRMIAAIAAMGNHDIHDDKVKALAYMCLCGNALIDIMKDIGLQVGTKLSVAAVNKISAATLTKINQAVGFRLLTKFGQTGIVNIGKAIPFVGGVVGGTIDGVSTKVIGKISIKTFLPIQ